MTPFSRSSSRRGFISAWLQIALGSVQIGSTGGFAWYQWRAGVEMREATAALQAAGYSLDPIAACAEEVPDEGNFGYAEPLRGISADEKDQTPEIRKRIKALEAFKHTWPTAPGQRHRKMPELSPDEPLDWAAWRNYLRDGMQWDVSEEVPNDVSAVFHALQKKTAEILPPLLKAAKGRKTSAHVPSQRTRYRRAIERKEPWLPGSYDFGDLVQLLRVIILQYEAKMTAGSNTQEEGLVDLQFALCDLVRCDTGLVALLMTTYCEQQYLNSAWRLAASGKLNSASLAVCQQYFFRREALEGKFARALHLELCYGDYASKQMVEQKISLTGVGGMAFELALDDVTLPKASFLEAAITAPHLERLRALNIQTFLTNLGRLKKGGLPAIYQWSLLESKKPRHWYDLFSLHETIQRGTDGAWNFMLPKLTWNDQRRQAFILTCALERHRLAGGKVPEKLTELPKALLPEIPADLDGQPLGYRREGKDSWVIWSVGIDLKDDWNGKAPPPPAKGEEKKEAWQMADWQWRLPRWDDSQKKGRAD